MKKTKTIRFVESLIFLPIMTMMTPLGTVPNTGVNMVNQPKVVILSQVSEANKTLKLEADAIDAYFAEHDMPLSGMGMKMAKEAEANDIDWRLLPAIAVRESTGGKNDCDRVKNNPFGWGSCKIGFKSLDEAIEIVAKNLGGNNPNTARHYDNKTTKQILRAYNPPSVVPRYVAQVLAIMADIGEADISQSTVTNA
jgi:hypothetical protein